MSGANGRVVHFGVVGAGVIAQRGIVPHLIQADVGDRVKLQAICDPVPGRAESVAHKFGIPQYFNDYQELLSNGQVQAVSIASPIGLHYEQGRQALLAGKHVHFNKTMCTTVEEADDLIELARARSLRIVASPGEVLRPHHRAIRQLIADGALGRLSWAAGGTAPGLYHIRESERVGRSGDAPILPDWYFHQPGGGPLYDTTVYPLHALTSVLGPATRVTAMSGVRIPVRHVDGRTVTCDAHDSTMMVLDFGDSLFALMYGMTSGKVVNGHTISYFGEKGSILGLELNGHAIDYPGRRWSSESERRGALQAELPHVTGTHRDIREAHVFEDLMQLTDWIRDGRPSEVTAEHARHVIDIIESSYRAAETSTTQTLRTTFALREL